MCDGACAGSGCCHIDIPPGFRDTSMIMSGWSHKSLEFCPCNYAFIAEKGSYNFSASDLVSSTHRPNNLIMTPLRVDWTMPLGLDWAIRENGSTSLTCSRASSNNTDHSYACISNRSECVDSANGRGYFCRCTQGYDGNPYVPDVPVSNLRACILLALLKLILYFSYTRLIIKQILTENGEVGPLYVRYIKQ